MTVRAVASVGLACAAVLAVLAAVVTAPGGAGKPSRALGIMSVDVRVLPAPSATTPATTPAKQSVDPTWLVRTVSRTGIPERALAAYAAADLRVSAEVPRCGIHWPTLAGIGAVESGHGAAGGGLEASGSAARPIIGVALDGRSGIAAVMDSDAGRLDGDVRRDRAVGPMQFIPTTWSRWRVDGDGDGAADPQDIDDAALAAAHYLCGAGADLSSAAGWTRAVLGYNASMDYVRLVNTTALRYAGASRG